MGRFEAAVNESHLRGDITAAECPSREMLRQVTGRWGVLVLFLLSRGTMRFSELRHAIGGVSEKMLAQTLKGLESHGLVKRVSHPVVPPHVDYSLTPGGKELARRVVALVDWIETNFATAAKAD